MMLLLLSYNQTLMQKEYNYAMPLAAKTGITNF